VNGGFHLRLFLIALTIAVGIKLAVNESEQIGERVIEAQVTYNQPAGADVVSYDKVETVRIGVRGASREIAPLTAGTVEVVVNLPQGTGPVPITLGPQDVRFRAVGDFEVTTIDPNRFTVQVEHRLAVTVPVIVSLTGEPSAGARHGDPVVRPAWVELSGPESQVRRVTRLEVEVSLDGHARTFEDSVQLAPPDPRLRVQPGRVLVSVPMQEPELSIDLQNDLPSGEEE
jgi:YbbR domain-containing protein